MKFNGTSGLQFLFLFLITMVLPTGENYGVRKFDYTQFKGDFFLIIWLDVCKDY